MAGKSQSRVVLVVDDDEAVRSALKFALEVEGFDVRDYSSPVALLNDGNLPPFDCLVVDYRMPVIDGLELVSVLRKRGVQASAIIITARSSKYLESEAAKVGIQKVLEKPLPDGMLVSAVHSAIAAECG